MYNIADSVIVGNFAARGEDALTTVDASYPITMIFMAVAMGCNVGCSVVISQLSCARGYLEMKTAISTTLLVSLGLLLLLTALGILLSRVMMTAIRMPENIFHGTDVYLRI